MSTTNMLLVYHACAVHKEPSALRATLKNLSLACVPWSLGNPISHQTRDQHDVRRFVVLRGDVVEDVIVELVVAPLRLDGSSVAYNPSRPPPQSFPEVFPTIKKLLTRMRTVVAYQPNFPPGARSA